MSEELKIQIRGNVNKIVQENLDNLDNIFSRSVYENADRCLYEIISEGQIDCAKNSFRDEQIANVISFLGKRGRGKTSAMLSFHTYLENLSERNIPQWSKLHRLENKKLAFHTIGYIDAAMLAENEFIIDVILAKMWDKFDTLLSKPYRSERTNYDYLVKKVQDEFINVRQAYLTMKYREKNFTKEIERDISTARGLHELATGINLKESIKKLVENYIQIFNNTLKDSNEKKGYLVLAIDDVDMANDKAWNILEQIRMYMSIPQIIILLTSDMERLRDVCEILQEKKMSSGMLSEFIDDYLKKVMPVNMRINMPELFWRQNEIYIKRNDESISWTCETEKDIILELIGKGCGIYFAGNRRKRHFMQNESLRSLVNYFNRVAVLEEKEYNDWLKRDLQERLIERVKNKEDKLFLKGLYNKDYRDINGYIIDYIHSNKRVSDESSGNYSMGQALYLCSQMEKRVDEQNFINCILLFYALILNENWNNTEIRNSIIGGSMFGEWEYAALSGKSQREEEIKGIEGRAVLRLIADNEWDIQSIGVEKYIERVLEKEEKKILAWLYTMLYIDIDIPESKDFRFEIKEGDDAENESKEEKEKKKDNEMGEVWRIIPYFSVKKGIFSFLNKESDDYKRVLELLLECIITKFYCKLVEVYNLGGTKEELQSVLKKKKSIIDKIEWGQKTDNSKLVMSTEILYCLGQMIERETQITEIDTEGQVNKLETVYKMVYEYLKEIDSYYGNKLQIQIWLAEEFKNSLQVKIFMDETLLEQEVKKEFKEFIKKIYKASNADIGSSSENLALGGLNLKKDN